MGLSLAKYIASRGGRVSIADVQESALNQAVDALAKVASLGSSAVLARQVDVRKTDQVDSWIEETKRTFGQLNGAANLAGVSGRMGIDPIVDQKDDDWEVYSKTHSCLLHGLSNFLQLKVIPDTDLSSPVRHGCQCDGSHVFATCGAASHNSRGQHC